MLYIWLFFFFHFKVNYYGMQLPGKRQRGRPMRRYIDAVREDMQVVGVRVEDAENRLKWKAVIRCGDP